ncbi:MAG: hypothetical protein AAFO68_05290, partial [Pseudomonadota bacterium]
MNRRSFLRIGSRLGGAAALSGLVPLSVLQPATATVSSGAVLPATHIIKWAETIVRAHNSCTTAMLQRHLHLDAGVAQLLKNKLIADGVVVGQANAYGIHKAVKPLYDKAFMQPLVQPNAVVEKVAKTVTDQDRASVSADAKRDDEAQTRSFASQEAEPSDSAGIKKTDVDDAMTRLDDPALNEFEEAEAQEADGEETPQSTVELGHHI